MRYLLPAAALVAAVWSGASWPLWLPLLVLAAGRAGAGSRREPPRSGRWACTILATALAGGLGLLALEQGLAARLPASLNGETLAVRARVVDLVERQRRVRYDEPVNWQRLTLEVRLLEGRGRWPGRHRVRVSAWGPLPALGAGDRFEARVRLYFPHGWHNQTGPDTARRDLAERIDAVGVLAAVDGPVHADGGPHAFRERLADRLRARLAASPLGAAVVPALVTGDRRGLERPLKDLFRATGTAHLLAISGLHLTLVTGLLWWLGRGVLAPPLQWLWPASRRLTLAQLAWAPALVGALGYAALAGFSLPTRRALIMVAVLALCRLRRRWPAPSEGLALALLAVLLVDPLAALSTGLWLSFGAVAAILGLLEGGGRLPVMVALPLPMAVAGAALFGTWAWWSPLANLLLVPLFSALVVPAALLGALLDWAPGLDAAATGVELAVALMEVMARWPAPGLPMASGMAALAVGGALLLGLSPAWPWPRRLLPLCLLPWWWPAATAPGPGQVDLIMFEVGQGQALALRTARHLVLYDLGPGWQGGSATGSVLVPWLRRHRLTPDLTLVSHGDGDHAGGLADLPDPGRLLSGEPDRVPGAERCRAGQHWRFDGVDFRVLWPDRRPWTGNDASCVLRVDAGGASVLLTGDITTAVEYRLLGTVAPVTVLQLGHHGSASSSADAWVRSLQPRWALASVGYANRFGHPDAALVRRLEAAGVTVLRTDRAGMIVFRLGGPDNAALITKWRRDHERPWHRPARGQVW